MQKKKNKRRERGFKMDAHEEETKDGKNNETLKHDEKNQEA